MTEATRKAIARIDRQIKTLQRQREQLLIHDPAPKPIRIKKR